MSVDTREAADTAIQEVALKNFLIQNLKTVFLNKKFLFKFVTISFMAKHFRIAYLAFRWHDRESNSIEITVLIQIQTLKEVIVLTLVALAVEMK